MNVDSIMASALEVLLAYTPEFSLCCPNYCDVAISTTIIKKDRRFLVWLPHQPHEAGVLYHAEASVTLARMECYDAIYEAIVLPAPKEDDEIIDDGLKRIHAQMQVALVEIAAGMGCKTYVAKNDQGIIVKNTPLAQHADVLTDLSQQNLISNFPDATKAGALIDCIWFKNGKHMPAVLEVEYTTGITSGLTRMLNFQDNSPSLVTRFIIAAPDEDRAKVIKEFEKIQFQKMKPVFLPFSAIHELYALAQRGRLKGVSPDIIDNFVERAAS
jgi:type II restriction enzyme